MSCALLCAAILCAPSSSAAQRLYARQDDAVVELQAGAAGFGSAIAALALPPGCTRADYNTSPATRVIDGGHYVAWERQGGVCLLDTATGRGRSLDTPFYGQLVAWRASGFGLVVATHALPGIDTTAEQLFLLNAFDDAWRVVDVTNLLPAPPPFFRSIWSYDISADTGELVIVESRDGGNRTLPLMTRVAIATGRVLSVASIAADVLVSEIAVSRDGAYAVALSDDQYRGANAILSVRTSTGDVVASNANVAPHKLLSLNDDSLVLDEAVNRVLVITHDVSKGYLSASGAAVLDARTLSVIATIDAPRARLPLLPGYLGSQMSHGLLHDPGTHTVFLLENEMQREQYGFFSADVRTELHAIDLVTGTVRRSADMVPAFPGLAGLLRKYLFLLPTPLAPQAPVATVAGSTVTLQWAASPGASYYRSTLVRRRGWRTSRPCR